MNSSEATLYELALRLIGALHYGPPPQDDLQLLVAQVPEGVLKTIPMLEGSHLLGSLTRTHQVMAVLDVDLPAERIIDFYRNHLAAAGWLEPTANQPVLGGFQCPQTPRALHLWQGPHGPTLSIQVYELRDRPADVRLTLNSDPTLSGGAALCEARTDGQTRHTAGHDSPFVAAGKRGPRAEKWGQRSG